MNPRPFVGVVADDITGAGDIGIMFAKHGYAVRIFSAATDLESLPQRLASVRTDVAIIDTDSRMDPSPLAFDKVRRATAALRAAGCTTYWKKTCSVFRGNVGVEFDAMLDELGESFGVTVAAFPRNGRVTINGIHSVHGRLLAQSEFALDPVHPRTQSDLVADVAGQTSRKVSLIPLEVIRQGVVATRQALDEARAAGVAYALCDGERQEDLAIIAAASASERVFLGSSGLAEEMPSVWAAAQSFDPFDGLQLPNTTGVLVVAGSVMPQSRAQVEAMADSGIPVLTLTNTDALTDPQGAVDRLSRLAVEHLRQGSHVVVRSENWPDGVQAARALGLQQGLDGVAVSRRISSLLAGVTALILAQTGAHRLITLGGDTSAAICRELGITETVVLQEIQAGLPSTLAPGDHPLLLVLKSGSFGAPDFGLKAIQHLQGLGKTQ